MIMINRRRFLQSAAGALGVTGLNQLTLSHRANQYGRTLARSTPRKVALLVGVNDYERNKLGGAINDVELQKQLLIHRFGFNPTDVHTLKNEEASRLNILGNFEQYLYEPAQAGDVVVFHFSGHGDHVAESELMRDFTLKLGRECIDNSGEFTICRNTAIAPHDYSGNSAESVQAIMGHTLLLMRAALAQKTDNVTFVLDCCYAGGGKRGNVLMRSLDTATPGQITSITPRISDNEWETQQRWLDHLNWTEEDFVNAIQSPTGPGYFAAAAGSRQYAADYPFEGFIAGAFTYLLTQHLWQATSPLSSTISTLSSSLSRLQNHDQTPEYEPDLAMTRSLPDNKTIYHIQPAFKPAEAVILGPKENTENQFHLWLGGLDPHRLAAFDRGARFSVVDKASGADLGKMQQISRDGLLSEGQLVEGNTAPGELTGQFLQERTRGIPAVVVLKIALDDTLTPTEQAYVKTALSNTASLEIFAADPSKPAHILLGRYTEEIAAKLISGPSSTLPSPPVGSIGIFSPSQVPMLTGSFQAPDELIETAVERLRSRFVSLHIGRMLALMVNGHVSQLNIDVAITSGSDRSGTTTRGGNPEAIIIPQQAEQTIEKIALGKEIDVTITNHQSIDLHFGMLAIDSAGDISLLFPLVTDDPNADIIRSRGSKTEPLVAVDPMGLVELLVFASPNSLVGPLETLRDSAAALADPDRGGEQVIAADSVAGLFNALDTQPETGGTEPKSAIAFHKNNRRKNDRGKNNGATQLLDVENVAVLSLLFEIVP